MFGGDEEDDFIPNPSSKLASLFGFGKSSEEGNTSLTYTAPKQPKKGRAESQNQNTKTQETGQTTSSSAKLLSIIIVKAVQTYKLAEGNYNAQGKLGAAVLGNTTTRNYQLLLYKGKQQHVTSCRITPQFQFVVQANNYATFYDDQTQNWSVMFETNDDAIEFAKEIGLARGNATKDPSEQKLMTQDLLFGVGSGAVEGDMVEVRYVVYPMIDGKIGQELENNTQNEKPLRVKIKKDSWEEGLVGVSKGCKRMIMLPPTLTGQWQTQVPPGNGVALVVDVGRIKSKSADSGDSTDDTSIKARGASISEALTNSPKTHKASIISRMARMGQATLPLKGAIACNPSDSEETEEETSVVNKAPAKARVTKSRPTVEKPIQNVMLPPQQVPQQVAVYQPLSVPWQQTTPPQPPQQHQFVRANGSMAYVQQSFPLQTVSTPQMYPVSTPPAMPSPESHLSVFLAETRTQNSELRMGVAKVTDKVDQVLMKMDTMQQLQQRRESSVGIMEPSALLASVQKLVSENESLRTELEEKRGKIEQLYTMLHSNMMESRNDTLVLTLQQEKAQLSADLGEARSRTSSLEMLLTSRGEDLVNSQQLMKDQEQKLAALQEQLSSYEQRVSDITKIHQEEMRKMENESAEIREQFRKEEHDITAIQEEMRKKESELAMIREEVKRKEHDTVAKMEHLRNLEQENTALRERVREIQAQKGSTSGNVVSEVKKVMNVVYHQTAAQFLPDTSYTGAIIKQMLMGTIRDVTLKYLEVQSKDDGDSSVHEEKTEVKIEKRETPPIQSVQQQGRGDSVIIRSEVEKLESSIKVPAQDFTNIENVDEKTYTKETKKSSDKHELEKPASQVILKEVGEISNKLVSNSDKVVKLSSEEASLEPSKFETEKPDTSLQSKAQVGSESKIMKDREQDKRGQDSHEEKKETKDTFEPKRLDSSEQSTISKGCEVEASTTNIVPEIGKEDSSVVTANSSRLKVEKDNSEMSAHEDKIEDDDKSSETSHTSKEKHSRDSSLERSWRPQPPPPPLFDDDDDDDDWLS